MASRCKPNFLIYNIKCGLLSLRNKFRKDIYFCDAGGPTRVYRYFKIIKLITKRIKSDKLSGNYILTPIRNIIVTSDVVTTQA